MDDESLEMILEELRPETFLYTVTSSLLLAHSAQIDHISRLGVKKPTLRRCTELNTTGNELLQSSA